MKINAIAGICKKSGTILRVEKKDGTWIGNGQALYFVPDLKNLDTNGIFTVFGINEKQREKIIFKNITTKIDLSDFADESVEEKIDEINIGINTNGKNLKVIKTDLNINFINSKYLSPVSDIIETMELKLRTMPDETQYIVVKNGMMIEAVIMPYNCINEKFCEELNLITNYCIEELSKKNINKNYESLKMLGENDAE
ncbi:MAG: hypothetical protein RR355_00030 [Oscillospiraceae bacterium]